MKNQVMERVLHHHGIFLNNKIWFIILQSCFKAEKRNKNPSLSLKNNLMNTSQDKFTLSYILEYT